MKTSGYLIFYLSENDDFDLWRVLSQIPPEERAATVKAALRKELLQERGNPQPQPQFRAFNTGKALPDSPVADLALEDLGLHLAAAAEDEALGKAESLEFFELDDFLRPSESLPKQSFSGLDFLLNNVIGEEDDESVIAYIKKSKASPEGEAKDRPNEENADESGEPDSEETYRPLS